MTDLTRPSPIPTAWSQPFWEALAEGRFVLQRCEDCGSFQGYPRVFCTNCYSDNLGWVSSTGRGEVYTHTTIMANPPSTFIDDLPYTLVIVTLAEGPRFLARLIDTTADDVVCGLAVELVIRDEGAAGPMPAFRPIQAGA